MDTRRNASRHTALKIWLVAGTRFLMICFSATVHWARNRDMAGICGHSMVTPNEIWRIRHAEHWQSSPSLLEHTAFAPHSYSLPWQWPIVRLSKHSFGCAVNMMPQKRRNQCGLWRVDPAHINVAWSHDVETTARGHRIHYLRSSTMIKTESLNPEQQVESGSELGQRTAEVAFLPLPHPTSRDTLSVSASL